MERFCCVCCEYRPLSLFYVAPENRDGYAYQCKECCRERMREYNKKRGYFKKYYYKKKGVSFRPPEPKVSQINPPSTPTPKIDDGVKQTGYQPSPTFGYCVSFE
jgi:hypothetical protein